MRPVENLAEQKLIALSIVAPFECAHALEVGKGRPVVIQTLAGHGFRALEGKPSAQRIGLASAGGQEHAQGRDAERRIDEKGFVQVRHIARVGPRRLIH